ncbi:MAG: pyrroline-5-carboxylate reductase [Eubacteriaceae bacterium]|jgi:pyrroline-5-carboxylate reductase|nr:pyrroline-5-carboxylate reductase [Eubacteriaceae bacterium]
MNKIGFIGCGNLGKTMVEGIYHSRLYTADCIYVADPYSKNLSELYNLYNIQVTQNTMTILEDLDIVVLAVKPETIDSVMSQIKDALKPDAIVISVAAGVTLSHLSFKLGENRKLVRTMPNTPALVGEAMTAVTFNEWVTEDEKEQIIDIFSCFGKAEIVEEKSLDAVTALSGSGPAYIYLVIEAMADGGVLEGLERDVATKLAAQTVLGAAKMVLDSGMHIGELKDMLSTPGGTTIEGLAVLEAKGVRSAFIEAERKAAEKSRKLL